MAVTLGVMTVEILARIGDSDPFVIGTAEMPIESTPDGASIDASALRRIFRSE